MSFKNTSTRYGSVTKFFHWTVVLLVLTQVYSIIHVSLLPEHSPLAGFLIGTLHKSIGILVLIFAFFGYFWRLLNVHPSFPPSMPVWEILSARLAHMLLYLCLFVMPISGLLMSTADGRPPSFFGLYQLPQFIEKNPAMANYFFNVHRYTAILLIGLVVLHTLAALKHHFINKDSVLKRMLP